MTLETLAKDIASSAQTEAKAILKEANASAKEGIVCDFPPELFSSLMDRETQIAVGELFAVILGFRQYSPDFSNSSAIAYIDNMSVIHILVNGKAAALDLSNAALAVHRRQTQLSAQFWWEYVNTKSNCSDGGSRDGVTCAMARALGIPLRHIAFPALPAGFPRTKPTNWDLFW